MLGGSVTTWKQVVLGGRKSHDAAIRRYVPKVPVGLGTVSTRLATLVPGTRVNGTGHTVPSGKGLEQRLE